ncbi:MAG: OmpH family outer membrane protein [Deltaproteobacteria bacterium]|nr:OmpH family outer membrane protein [Deltaproteobacteria bacterium]
MTRRAIVSVAVWLLSGLAFFPSAGWPQEALKVGVVDMRRVISESQAGKQVKEKFGSEIKKAEAEMAKEKRELERLKSDLDKKGALLKAEEKQELERQLQRRYRDYLRGMQDAGEELKRRESEVTSQLINDLREIVHEIGKKESFTFILSHSQALYNGTAIDITDRVIELYNQRRSKAPKAGN